MKTRDSKDVVRPEGVAAPTTPFYVVECDAYELPEFHEREQELITHPANRRYKERIMTEAGMDPKRWFGGELAHTSGPEIWTDAKRLLQEGWAKGAKEARLLSEQIMAELPEPESARRKPVWKDEGDEIDRDRLWAGEIDTMWRGTTKVVQRAPRVIRIAANWSMNCGFSATQIKWNGVAITALLDVLERSNYGSELLLGFPLRHSGWSGGDNYRSMPVVRVKTAGDPVDLSNIAVVAGNAGLYRTYGFAMVCSAPYDAGYSLGGPSMIRSMWEEAVKAGVCEPVDAYMETSASKDQAIDQIKTVLRDLFPDLKFAGESADV